MYIYTYRCVYVYPCIRICKQVYTRVCVHVHAHVYMCNERAYTHTCVRMYMHVSFPLLSSPLLSSTLLYFLELMLPLDRLNSTRPPAPAAPESVTPPSPACAMHRA